MVSRVYVEKKPGFDVEAQQLLAELRDTLGIEALTGLRVINRYDVEGIDGELFGSCVPTVFSEPQVDFAYDELPEEPGATVFAVEALPGQFDQRAASAAVTQQSMNERFTASGLNSGAQGQAALALGIAAQGELAGLDAERASRLADIESRRAQTKAQYQNAVAQAIAQNEIERANALYQEAVRVDNSFAAIDAELLEQLTASTTAAQAAVSSYVPSGTGTGTGTQTRVLSGYEKTAAQVSGAKTTASKLAIIQNALSSGAITSAQAGLLRSQYGLPSAGVITPVSGGGGGKVTAAIK